MLKAVLDTDVFNRERRLSPGHIWSAVLPMCVIVLHSSFTRSPADLATHPTPTAYPVQPHMKLAALVSGASHMICFDSPEAPRFALRGTLCYTISETGTFTMNTMDRIVVDPEILAGKPVVRGTRLANENLHLICTRLG
jgi:hypothetical protein